MLIVFGIPVDEVADVIPESLNESGLKTAFLFASNIMQIEESSRIILNA